MAAPSGGWQAIDDTLEVWKRLLQPLEPPSGYVAADAISLGKAQLDENDHGVRASAYPATAGVVRASLRYAPPCKMGCGTVWGQSKARFWQRATSCRVCLDSHQCVEVEIASSSAAENPQVKDLADAGRIDTSSGYDEDDMPIVCENVNAFNKVFHPNDPAKPKSLVISGQTLDTRDREYRAGGVRDRDIVVRPLVTPDKHLMNT